MFRKALVTALALSVLGIACDDDVPPRPRDGGTDARRDGGTDARDAASDRAPDAAATPDTAPPVDRIPDVPPDSSVPDRGVDTPVPTPDAGTPDSSATPDTNPPPPDTTPDTTPDMTPDTAPDMTPDTAPDMMPDTMIDTAIPDAAIAQPFVPMNGCEMESQFDDVTGEAIHPFDWIIENDEPHCFKVKHGNLVRWVIGPGFTFANHPVEQFPVDPTSRIQPHNAANDDDYDVVFNGTVGTFGFRCSIHTGIMRGAVWVVP
jgi:hypothetical protein